MRFLTGRSATRLTVLALLPLTCAATTLPAAATAKTGTADAAATAKTGTASAAEAAKTGTADAAATARSSTAGPRPAASRIPGNGRFVVGRDVRPGIYRSSGNRQNCHWKRTAPGVVSEGISPGLQIVTVRRGDVFRTARCNTWQRIG